MPFIDGATHFEEMGFGIRAAIRPPAPEHGALTPFAPETDIDGGLRARIR